MTGLHIRLALRASPVLPKEPPLDLREADRKPKEQVIEVCIALDELPELLPLDPNQRAHLDTAAQVLRNLAG